MQTSNQTKGKSYTPNKINSPNAQEPEQPSSYLASLFQPPADPVEAEIERAKLHGRQAPNTHKSGSFTF